MFLCGCQRLSKCQVGIGIMYKNHAKGAAASDLMAPEVLRRFASAVNVVDDLANHGLDRGCSALKVREALVRARTFREAAEGDREDRNALVRLVLGALALVTRGVVLLEQRDGARLLR